MQKLNKEIVDYINDVVLPQYNNFDQAHNQFHIKNVQKRSLEYFEFLNDPNLNINIVYVVASYHDIGCKIQRKNHPIYSGQIVRGDGNLKKWFSDEEIELIAQACEDHSTSSGHDPRSIYGKIVSDADKDRDLEICLLRGWDFIDFHRPDMTFEEKVEDVRMELVKRFCDHSQGGKGLVKFYIKNEGNESFVQKMKECCLDVDNFKNTMLAAIEKRSENENNN